MATGTPKTPSTPEDKPKSTWDSILTSTPVVLTVLATLLAGLSSSEMTKAQYHRALAAQHQSKAGDQWGFFQAKRIRGTSLESNVRLLRAMYDLGPITPDTLTAAAARVTEELGRLEKDADALLQALDAARAKLGSGGEGVDAGAVSALRSAAERLRDAAHRQLGEAQAVQKRLADALARPPMQDALGYLDGKRLPKAQRAEVGTPAIDAVAQAILARKTEDQTADLVKNVSPESVHQAIADAQANANAFDQQTGPVGDALDELGKLVRDEAALVQAVHRAAREAERALSFLPRPGPSALGGVFTAADQVARADARLIDVSEQLQRDLTAAVDDYNARRYRQEAKDNEAIAHMYEVQVHRSSWESERHRTRSAHFFYAMLAAQAGVTIATLALAIRRRSVLWAIASLAGVGAVLFSAYVFWYV